MTLAVLMKAVWCKAQSKVGCHGEVVMFQANASAMRMKASTAAMTPLISTTTPVMAQASTAATLIATIQEL